MDITGSELITEYEKASANWPFIHQTEQAHGLPRMLLFAVGSRETNLTNEVGDFGHGHGVWQLDDRSHDPAGGWAHFDGNVPLQCTTAAEMLHSLLATTGGKVEAAAAIYNSGQESRGGTTPGPGSHVGDYGLDVLERMHYLQAHANGGGGGGGGTAGVPAWFTRDLLLEKPQMTGADVKIVQKKTGATVDGFFGPDTQKHVISFQSHHGLQADGAVGSKTAKVLGS